MEVTQLQMLLEGLIKVFNFGDFSCMLLGVITGIIFGAIPGLTGATTVAVLLPLSFALEPTAALLLLAGGYAGAMYGGSISAILLNTPGAPPAAATALDGYPLARQGRGGEALGIAAFASGFGGFVSAVILILCAPIIANFAINFGAPEYFLLAVFGLTAIASVGGKSLVKGFASGIIGMLIGSVGQDPILGYPRYVFGNSNLLGGFALVPILIGILSLAQLFNFIDEKSESVLMVEKIVGRILPTFSVLKKLKSTLLISSLIGTIVGAIPGEGATVASFLAYNRARNSSKHPEKFGTGMIEGVAAAESANNGCTGGSLTTMFTLGIPGSASTAIMLGALMIHGLRPGPMFFTKTGDIAYTFMAGFLLANILMVLIGLSCSRFYVHLVKVPKSILVPPILAICVLGSYSLNNSMFDVAVMFFAGVFGYLLYKLGFNPVALTLGFILGPLAESNFRRALLVSDAGIFVFLTRPISVILICITVLTLILPYIQTKRAKKKELSYAK